MPNPLTVMMTSPAATGKQGANPQAARDSQGASSFQTVMDQEAESQPDLPETPVPQAQEAEVENVEGEVEAIEVEVLAEDALPAAAPKPEESSERTIADDPQSDTVFGLAPNPNQTVVATAPKSAPQPSAPSVEEVQQTQRVAASAFQILGQSRTLRTETSAAKAEPKTDLPSPTTAETLPKVVPDPKSSVGSERGIPRTQSTPEPTPKQPPLPDRAPSVVQMQLLATEKTANQTDAAPVHEIEESQTIRESQVFSSAREASASVQSMTATARAETARAIASQMATAITTRPQSGAIEVALNPEELGRVSIVLNGRDDGLHMAISAERPETLDMIRRHLSVLEAEFKNLGLGDLSIDMGTSSDAQQDEAQGDDPGALASMPPDQIDEASPAPARLGADGRIDIRM